MRVPRPFAAPLAALLLLTACDTGPSGPPSPALWEVTGPDGAHGWLFGTAHSLPDGYDWGTPKVDAALAQAAALIVEVNLANELPDHAVDLARTPGMGSALARVGPAYRERLAAAFNDVGVTDAMFEDVETWGVALGLATNLTSGASENGADLALIRQAGAKPVVELEGYTRQLAIFDQLPEAEQADMLEIVAAEAENAEADAEKQLAAWRSGKIEVIEAEMDSGLLADPELREALLTRRNQDWAVQVDTMLKTGDALFIAVGLAHLLGEEGLPALLEKRGYTVKRIQ